MGTGALLKMIQMKEKKGPRAPIGGETRSFDLEALSWGIVSRVME